MLPGPVPGKGKCWNQMTAGPLFTKAGVQGRIGETGGSDTQAWTDEQVIRGKSLDKSERIRPLMISATCVNMFMHFDNVDRSQGKFICVTHFM